MKRIAPIVGAVTSRPVCSLALRWRVSGAVARRCAHASVQTEARTGRLQNVTEIRGKSLFRTLEDRGLINQIAGYETLFVRLDRQTNAKAQQ